MLSLSISRLALCFALSNFFFMVVEGLEVLAGVYAPANENA